MLKCIILFFDVLLIWKIICGLKFFFFFFDSLNVKSRQYLFSEITSTSDILCKQGSSPFLYFFFLFIECTHLRNSLGAQTF